MLYVFTTQTSARLTYILDELIGRRMGIDFFICDQAGAFNNCIGARINYSHLVFNDTINIRPHTLLFENDIREQEIEVKDDPEWRKIFFQNLSETPFDIFAASFFLLSRYEEYLPHKNDVHGRYLHWQSIAVKNNFIEIPIVDIWAQLLKEKILQQFPSIAHRQNHFRFLSTIDIDFAYKYQGIGLKRHLFKLVMANLHFRLKDELEQILVIAGLKKDPYDTYAFIQKSTEQNSLPLMYFFLMRTGTPFDKNIFPKHPLMKDLVEKLSEHAEIGLHPSYFSNVSNKLAEEKSCLETVSQKRISNTRQHFLKFSLPDTYHQLIEHGFSDDYSMAYSAVCGFRASTSFPFCFFDPVKNKYTALSIHPTMVMDVTLRNYQQLSPAQAIKTIEQLMNEVKKVNGTFISLWHNSNLDESKEWEGWNEVFEKMHTLANIKTKK